MAVQDPSKSWNCRVRGPFTGPYRTNHLSMETKHRTLIQAAVLLILLVFVATGHATSRKSEATAQVVSSE